MPLSYFENGEGDDIQLIQQAFECSPECSPNKIFIIDPKEMKYVNANQAALDFLGYTKEELRSKKLEDIDAVFTNEMMAAAFKSIICSKEKQATIPTVFRCKDGNTVEVEVFLRCFTENNHTYIFGSAASSSVLKRVQDKLHFHSALFNSISDAIVATDENFYITSYNKHAQEIFGWKEDEAIGKNTRELTSSIYPNATSEEVIDFLFKNGYWRGEIITHRKSREQFPALLSIGTLKDVSGRITGTVAVIRDITERKKLEEQLKQFNDELERRVQEKTAEIKEILERVSDSIVALDNNDCYTYLNREAHQLLQRPPGYLIGKNVWKEYPGTIGQPFHKAYMQAVATRQHQSSVAYDNTLKRWIENHFYPSSTGISIYGRDITEKKQAEIALKESELQYRTIVETVQEGIWQVDENGNTIFVNDFMAKLLGCRKEEIIGVPFIQFVPEDGKQHALEQIEEGKKGKTSQFEFTFITKDGSSVYTLLQVVPVFKEDKYAGALTTVLDISERKKEEEKNRFKADLLNTIGQATIATDIHGNVTYWNKAAENIYGWTEEEAIGNNIVELTPAHQSREQALQIMESLKKGKSWSGEFSVQRKDGTIFPALVTDAPIYDEQGKLTGIIGVSSDITERNRIQEALLISERNYRLLFEENPVPLWMTDTTTFNFIDINPAGVAQYGYTKEEFICMNPEDIKVPEERYQVQKLKENMQKSFEKVVRHIKKNGDIIYVRVTGNLIIYNGREVWLAAGRDITQELLNEQHLKQSEQQLSLVFNSTENAMWLMKVEDNKRFRLQLVNNAFADFCNIDKEDLNSRLLDELFDMSKYQHLTNMYVACIENGVAQKFTNTDNVNGKERIFDFTVVPIKGAEGKVTQLLGICNDITERKKAERLLIESKEKYKILFEKSPLPKWIYDSQTLRFLEVNHTATVQYGYSKEEFLGMTLFDIKPKEKAKELLTQQFNGWPEIIDIDSVHLKKNGELIKVHVTANALHYENRPARMAIVVDRTEQEKAKDELIATTQQLRELASHLQDIREEERTYIAREIHDELGQQLTALKMDISWLNRKWNKENDSISNKLKGAVELIDLTINSVRKIAAQLRPSMLDDLGLAEAIEWQSREFSRRTGIAVTCSINVPTDKFSPPISIAVFRIFQEALTNIARHAGATEVICSLQKENKILCLTITDNGIGFNLNEQSKRRTLGILGMKERAIMLNGKYNINSIPGEGTKILVEIPLGD